MPKIYAHRGASGYFPENTMLAFRKAIEMRSDGVEIDVQMTKDGVVVICHDESVDRTTNGKGYIKDLTYGEILKFDAGQGEVIPTLDEFLALCAENGLEANIELKNTRVRYDGLEKAVEALLRKHDMIGKTIVSSFNHKSLALTKELFPEIKTALLYSEIIYHPERYAALCKADAIHPYYVSVDKSDVINCRKNFITVNVWTVDAEKDMKSVAGMDVDGIITNFPDVCRKNI